MNPLKWTERQLQLLEYQFRRRNLKSTRQPEPMNNYAKEDKKRDGNRQPQTKSSHAQAALEAVGQLREPAMAESSAAGIRKLLAGYGIHRFGYG